MSLTVPHSSAAHAPNDLNVTSLLRRFSYLTGMIRRIALFLVALLLPAALHAQDVDNVVTVDLVPGWRTADGAHMAGLRISLAPRWKTYWRAPGSAGLPPELDLSGSENIKDATLHFPSPELLEVSGMESFGYHGSVLIPIELAIAEADQPARAKGQIEIGVCDTVCLPFATEFDISLPPVGRRDPAIVSALLDMPQDGIAAGLGPVTCRFRPDGNGLQIEAELPISTSLSPRAAVIEFASKDIWVSNTRSEIRGTTLVNTADAFPIGTETLAIDRASVRLTLLTDDAVFDFQGCQS